MPHVLTKDLRLVNGVLQVVNELVPRSRKLIAVGEGGSLRENAAEKDDQRQLRRFGGTGQSAYSSVDENGGAAGRNVVYGTSKRLSESTS